jgi:MFS family permease
MAMSLETRLGRSPLLLTRMAAFVAVGIALGLALAAIPNVELVTAVCFISGFLLGVRAGVVTGGLIEALFAGFHPLGSSLGLVLIAQMAGMALAGLLGGVAARVTGPSRRGIRYAASIVLAGAVATIVFDALTNLAFPVMAGFSLSQTLVTLAAGVPFAAIHLFSNLLVFGVLVRPLIPRLERVWLAS